MVHGHVPWPTPGALNNVVTELERFVAALLGAFFNVTVLLTIQIGIGSLTVDRSPASHAADRQVHRFVRQFAPSLLLPERFKSPKCQRCRLRARYISYEVHKVKCCTRHEHSP